MEILSNLALGFSVAVTLQNLLYCFIGVFLGTLIGVLPGIGPVATVAMLLPLTFNLHPATAMIMLAGIYYGAQYGGSTTAILVNIPGESSSVVTTIDGHQMAKQGRAGPALGMAAIASFIAGSVATLVVALFSPPLAEIALKFGPADYFSLMVFGLVGAVVLARGSLRKAIAMVVLGLLFGLVGTDVNSGQQRFTLGIPALAEGISFAALAMGMFGVAEVIYNLEQRAAERQVVDRRHRPRDADARRSAAMPVVDRTRDRARRIARHPARWRRVALVVCGLHRGEEGRARAEEFRRRRHPRRRRARGGEQCRRADLVHPDAHARRAVQSDHGADDRGADDPGHPARTAGDAATAGIVLGHCRVDVDRQPVPAAAQLCRWSGCGCGSWRSPIGCCSRPS